MNGPVRPDTPAHPIILDCTIRDGSYAIDFKFTAEDTALVAGLLDEAGLRYVEVGHGLGLGASEAGQGRAASADLEVIAFARERATRARLGAFFIPGVGTEDRLREAREAGLDFVRIGQNADRIEEAWPYVEAARGLGLEVFVNFMKTYGIEVSEFAERAVEAEALGAAGVYVVDSAGGMLPEEVRSYVEQTRLHSDIPVGFHGHSNLHLAVANSLVAWEAGARFVDTSVYGIGRSSGNVPTEVMAAVFDRLGVDCGVDALAVVDIAEAYLRPLAEHLHPHTMVAVALGYGQFHSAFLSRALAAAREAQINPFRLIVALGRADPMELSDELLEETVHRLADSSPPLARGDLAQFPDRRFGPRRIGNRPSAARELIEGLEVVAAKRHLAVVLDLVASPALDEEDLSAELVLDDGEMALGRVRFGSAEAATGALAQHSDRIELALLDLDVVPVGEGAALAGSLSSALAGPVIPYRSSTLGLESLADAAMTMLVASEAARFMVCSPGTFAPSDVASLVERLRGAAPADTYGGELPNAEGALVVVAGPLGSASAPSTSAGRAPTIFLGTHEGVDPPGPGVVVLAREDAYRGTLHRWRRAAHTARAGPMTVTPTA